MTAGKVFEQWFELSEQERGQFLCMVQGAMFKTESMKASRGTISPEDPRGRKKGYKVSDEARARMAAAQRARYERARASQSVDTAAA